jgi:transketolase
VRATKEVIGFDPDRSFVVDEAVYAHMSLRERGAEERASWAQRLARWRVAHPELGAEWDRAAAGKLAEGWRERLPRFASGDRIATRAAGEQVMAALAEFGPTMVGGAADLVESTKTHFPGAGEFARVHAGRNIPFGIREHAMGAIVNGAAAHGGIVKPYGSTFLIFSDYMRPAIRLSALMGLPVIWVYTHDSIGLGEDGPTHQPIEHFAALRAIPFLWVIRPSDANETAIAWRVALERPDGPVALLLSRQALPVLERGREHGEAEGLERGAYVLWESASDSGGGDPELVMIATGSEVAPTLAAARSIAAEGRTVRVVAMPCMELFEAQPEEYRAAVLGPPGTARLAIEAGVRSCWWRWVGEHGDVHGIERFGASAPGKVVLEHFGFDAKGIAERARALLG